MIKCQNCGNVNTDENKFCRFCGTRFLLQQESPQTPYDLAAPRPYAWKTDEFSTQSEARRTIDSTIPLGKQGGTAPIGQYQPQHLAYQQPQHLSQPYACPHCRSHFLPRVERRISTAGWITFAVLLVFFFPLFWIGLLIKEDVRVCPGCNSKVS
jgi:RNA polymerase subunit RPABC4/transcription elongation factor Spt4